MTRQLQMLLIIALIFAALPVPQHAAAARVAAVAHDTTSVPGQDMVPASAASAAQSNSSGLAPLPRGCGSGLPPGASEPACCIFGYVVSDGEAVEGAYVQITNMRNGQRLFLWTASGPDGSEPYYRASLSSPPLDAREGDRLEIYVQYSSRERRMGHIVRNGSQQVDVVVPHAPTTDYTAELRYWEQTPRGTFSSFMGDLATDGSGVIYATDARNTRVQSFTPDGQVIAAWGSLGFAPGEMLNPVGIAVSSDGVVYVADQGRNGVHRFSLNGTWLGTWDDLLLVRGITTDNAGNVYIVRRDPASTPTEPLILKLNRRGAVLGAWATTGTGNGQLGEAWGIWHDNGRLYISDWPNNRVSVFTTEGVFERHIGVGELNLPARVAVHPDGTIYVADTGNSRIAAFTPQGALIPAQTFDSPLHPTSVVFDQVGNLIVADEFDDRVKVYSRAGVLLRQWGGTGEADRLLRAPNSATFDASANLYIAERDLERVAMFSPAGKLLRRFTVTGTPFAPIDELGGIVVDSAGNLSVLDVRGLRVVVFRPDGTISGAWSAGDAVGSRPVGLAIDAAGNSYIADEGLGEVRKYSPQRTLLWTRSGQGVAGGALNQPRGVAVDGAGKVYVADTGNGRVQTFNPDGSPAGLWTDLGVGGFAPPVPSGIAVGPDGVVFVADESNARFLRYSANGTRLSSFGNFGISQGAMRIQYIAVGPGGRVATGRADAIVYTYRPATSLRPLATISSVSAQVVTAGESVTVTGLGQSTLAGQSEVRYQWLFAGSPLPGATSEVATISTAGLAAGRYLVTLRVEVVGQGTDERSLEVEVLGSPNQEWPRSWTFLLYLAGDNPDIASFLDERSALGAIFRLRADRTLPPNVTVVALYDGPANGDTVRWVLRPDGSELREALGERPMDDPATLVEFVRQGRTAAPADHYYLAIANHGNAIDGIAWDRTSDPRGEALITNAELRQALAAISDNGALPIDVLHLDACLMGLVESAYQMRGHARYLVVSESLAWSAFAYERYRDAVGANTDPAAFARIVADTYAQRLRSEGYPFTISVLNLTELNAVVLRADALAAALIPYAQSGPAARTVLTGVRNQVQKLDSNGDQTLATDDEYVSLDHLAELLATGVPDPQVRAEATALREALAKLVIFNQRSSGRIGPTLINLDNARGVGIYYPERPGGRLYQRYAVQLLFAADSAWDEFLQTQLAPLTGDIGTVPSPNPIAPLPLETLIRVYLPLTRR